MENIVLEKRLNDQYWRKHLMLTDAQTLLSGLEKQVSVLSGCHIPVHGAVALFSQPVSWWREVSCAGNFHLFQYYYVMEDLSRHTCSYIEQDYEDGPKKAPAGYFRLTLFLVNPDSLKETVMLQSVVVVPVEHGSANCQDELSKVEAGRVSWRELI